MAKLRIKTELKSVVLVGEFCNWDIDKAVRLDRNPKNKTIVADDFPKGEYRVLSCKNYQYGEVYPTDGRQMSNRYFSGEENETIYSYFN